MYADIVRIASSNSLIYRAAACAAVEGEPSPVAWALTHAWALAASPGWDASWASGEVIYPGQDVGAMPDVISDGMILAAVQALRTESA